MKKRYWHYLAALVINLLMILPWLLAWIYDRIGLARLVRSTSIGRNIAIKRAKVNAELWQRPWNVYYIRGIGYFEGVVGLKGKPKVIRTIKP